MVWTLLENGRSPITMSGTEMEYSRAPEVEKNTTNLEWGYKRIDKRAWSIWVRWRNYERRKLGANKHLQKILKRLRRKRRRILESRNTRITDSLIHTNHYHMIGFKDILWPHCKAWSFMRQHWTHIHEAAIFCSLWERGASSVCDVDRYVIIGNLHMFICR
jgi:hypothetical protein